MALINSSRNGATERPGTSNDSLFVFLAGPIRAWWSPELERSALAGRFFTMRDVVHEILSNEFLVYAPHRAWRGPWNERAQLINNLAITQCHAFVYLRVPGVQAAGTDEELSLAISSGAAIYGLVLDDRWDNGLRDLTGFLKKQDKERRGK